MTARSFRVKVPGTNYGASIPPAKASTVEEAAAEFRAMLPQLDHYTIRVHRLGDRHDEWTDFPAIRRIA